MKALRRRDVVIVGGGWTGLLMAKELGARTGLSITVLERDGQTRGYRTAHVYEVRDGKLATCWEQPQDLFAFDDAWDILPASAAMR